MVVTWPGVALFVLASVLAGCKPTNVPLAREVPLVDPEGKTHDLRAEIARSPFAVITFFSAHCPCQRAHDARLRELYAAFAPRGVRFVSIDAEAGAGPERALIEARARAYPFPIWSDMGALSAADLGAEFATYTVVVDGHGKVRYAGGIDSDRSHLTDDATPYLRDALEDVLSGREPRVPRGKVLGCALSR